MPFDLNGPYRSIALLVTGVDSTGGAASEPRSARLPEGEPTHSRAFYLTLILTVAVPALAARDTDHGAFPRHFCARISGTTTCSPQGSSSRAWCEFLRVFSLWLPVLHHVGAASSYVSLGCVPPSASQAGDIILIQGAVGDKMGAALQNASTFITGLLIGFIKGWQLTLVILVGALGAVGCHPPRAFCSLWIALLSARRIP